MKTPENPLFNEQAARREAKRFAGIEDRITTQVRALITRRNRTPKLGVHLGGNDGYINIEDDRRTTLESYERGTGTILYKDVIDPTSSNEDPLELPWKIVREVIGVQTNRFLNVALHTDIDTISQLEELMERTFVSPLFLMTEYYFDNHGNYGKVSYLPLEIEDNRLALKINQIPMVGGKFVLSPMQPNDFLIAEIALQSLTDAVNGQEI